MLQVTARTKVFLAKQPVDFRKGIDGLAAVCRRLLEENPYSGSLFVFRNRKGSSIKILVYDGQGFWLCQKRLSEGRLTWWPSGDEPSRVLSTGELHTLLWNGNPATAQVAPDWRKVE